ncbi:hypothetical protein CBS147323_7210 [Aspergillus niger]|nr:hypothetical protein CBS147323_7210 [Aspergillus niger]
MQFTLTNVLAFALATQTEDKCDISNVSCCNPTNEDKIDCFLNNLLEWGVVGSLVNALDKDTPEGPVCENVIACCPGQGARCVGFGSGSGSGSGYSD